MLTLIPEAFAWREVDGQVIALHLKTTRYLSVSGSALVLWHALVQGATRDDLNALLCRKYGIDPDRARRDVNAFLTSLRELDSLREDGP